LLHFFVIILLINKKHPPQEIPRRVDEFVDGARLLTAAENSERRQDGHHEVAGTLADDAGRGHASERFIAHLELGHEPAEHHGADEERQVVGNGQEQPEGDPEAVGHEPPQAGLSGRPRRLDLSTSDLVQKSQDDSADRADGHGFLGEGGELRLPGEDLGYARPEHGHGRRELLASDAVGVVCEDEHPGADARRQREHHGLAQELLLGWDIEGPTDVVVLHEQAGCSDSGGGDTGTDEGAPGIVEAENREQRHQDHTHDPYGVEGSLSGGTGGDGVQDGVGHDQAAGADQDVDVEGDLQADDRDDEDDDDEPL